MASKPLLLLGGDDISRRPTAERISVGMLNLGPPGPILTISGSQIVVPGTHTVHPLAAPSVANSDLNNIIGGEPGDLLILVRGTSTVNPKIKEGTGNLKLNKDFTMKGPYDNLTLYFTGSVWAEIARSPNG